MIHQSAIIHESAQVAEDVEIGPYCIIGPNVKLGKGSKLMSHVVLDGHTTIGDNNVFFPFCSIGAPPQDLTYKDEPTQVIIGDNNIFREYVSVHRGTLKQDQITQIGSNSLFMAYVHFGHDVTIGSHVVIANSVNLAGHVSIGDRCIIGGATSVSQFVSLGEGSYIGGGSACDRDVPMHCTAYGNRIKLKGINIIGLKRMGIEKQAISEVVDFYRSMESSALSPRAFINHPEFMEDFEGNEIITKIRKFIEKSEIGIAPFMA